MLYLFPMNYAQKYACAIVKKTRSVPRCTLYVVNFAVYLTSVERDVVTGQGQRGLGTPVRPPISMPFLQPSSWEVILVSQRCTVTANVISSLGL